MNLPALTLDTAQRRPWNGNAIRAVFLLPVFFFLLTGLVLVKVAFITTVDWPLSFWAFYGVIVTTFLLSRIPYAYLYEDKHDVVYPDQAYPSVSVIIPAKNEGKDIFSTIISCIDSDYPASLECIVIDDGSTDTTREEILRARELYPDQIKLIVFPLNRGKREAIATGVVEAKNDVLIFIDSDSFLGRDSIQHITEHFLADARVGAVSGNTKVKNVDANILTRMQSIQYDISYNIYKAGESVHRTVTCCPGCFSAYRKEAIGPLIHSWKEQQFLGVKGTFGDDRSLTNFVLKTWDVVFCEKAKAETTVPERFSVYWRQQLRWKKSWIREGILAGLFMWRRHPLASIGFYIHFSFPFMGPILAAKILVFSIAVQNPFIFVLFMTGFILIGMLFSFFVHIYRGAKNWLYMPFFSILFVSVLIWQMPYALLTVQNTRWGTR